MSTGGLSTRLATLNHDREFSNRHVVAGALSRAPPLLVINLRGRDVPVVVYYVVLIPLRLF